MPNVSTPRSLLSTLTLVTAFLCAAQPALAHHVMDGQLPQTFIQGLLSGFGHPLIGLDHLAFVLAVGLITATARISMAWKLGLPLVFVTGTLIGTGLHLQLLALPQSELIIALSVLLAGGLLLAALRLPALPLALLFLAAGVFHGYAYGESIVGAETAPLAAYLIGFAIIQYAIAQAARLTGERINRPLLRIAGGLGAAFGLLLTLQHLA